MTGDGRPVISQIEPHEVGIIKELTAEYFAELGITLDPENLDTDLADPLTGYAGGGFLLLRLKEGGPALGCVGLVRLSPALGEVKRMFLKPEARGKGAGRKLLMAVLDLARERGFTRVVLDTMRKLGPANRLYEDVGFVDIDRYNDNPRAQRFMELEL